MKQIHIRLWLICLYIVTTLSVVSCGATICYTDPNTGIKICEKINGQFDPEISMTGPVIDPNEPKLDERTQIEIIPTK